MQLYRTFKFHHVACLPVGEVKLDAKSCMYKSGLSDDELKNENDGTIRVLRPMYVAHPGCGMWSGYTIRPQL